MSDFKMVKLVDPIVVQTNGVNASILGNTAGTAAVVSSGTMYLAGGNNVTLSQSGNTISINGGAGAGGGVANAAGTQTATSGTVGFVNSNGISFGMSGSSQITASYTVPAAQTVQTQNLHNLTFSGNTAGVMAQVSSGTVTLAGGNNITLSQNGNAVTISGPNTVAQTQYVFSNSNGVSFGTNGSTVTATVATNYQSQGAYLTTARASNDAVGLNTAKTNVTWTVNSSGISIDGGGYAGTGTSATNASITLNSNGLAISVAPGGGGADGYNIIAAGTQTAGTATSVKFADSNGISFGMSNSSQITASYTVPSTAGLISAINVSGGTTSNNLSKITFNDSNGISFGLNGSVLTATVATNYQSQGAYLTTAMQSNAATISNINLSAGTTSLNLSKMTFADSNGITFGLSGNSVITATVATNYQSQGAYLTTARASNDAIGLNTAKTNVTWTVNSSGISIDAGAYLTTAMASNRGTDFVQANAAFAGTNASGTIASNGISVSVANPSAGVVIAAGTRSATTAGNLLFDTGNGITFGLNAVGGSIMTASHNGLTTARASTDGIGLATAQTNVTWTANSAGLSINAAGYAGTATAVTGSISATVNSGGVSLSIPAFLTTAAQSSASNISGVIAATASNAATSQTAQLSGAVSFANGSGVSFFTTVSGATSGIAASVKTDYQTAGAYLTTARASNDAVGLNTAITNGTWTVNSSGISLNLSNHLTTARASTDAIGLNTAGSNMTWTANSSGLSIDARGYAGTGSTFAGTNVSGSMTVNSNGVNLALSAGAGGGVNPAASASNGSFNFTTLNFSNANNVTFGTSAGGIVTASVAAPGAAAENNWVNLLGANTAGNTTASGSTIGWSGSNLTLSGTNGSQLVISAPATSSLSATGGISLSVNGSTISIGYGSPLQRFEYPEGLFTSLGQTGLGSLSINHAYVPFNVTATAMRIALSISAGTNTSATTGSVNNSLWMGIYTLNGSTLSLASSGSAQHNFAFSQTASTTGNSSVNSMRQMTVPMNINMTPGEYWVAAVLSQATTYTSVSMNIYGNSQIASGATNAVIAPIGGATGNVGAMFFQGIYTANTSAGPTTIVSGGINASSASNAQRANFYWQAYNANY